MSDDSLSPMPQPPIPGHPRKRANPFAWLLIGIPLGVLATIAAQQAFKDPQPHFVRFIPKAEPTVSLPPIVTEPTPSLTPEPSPSPSITPPVDEGPYSYIPRMFRPNAPTVAEGAGSQPIPTNIPSPLQGNLQPLPLVGPAGSTMATGQVQPPNGVPPIQIEAPPVALVTMLLPTGEADMDAAEAKIKAAVKKLGGTIVKFSELAEKKEADRAGLLISFAPEKKDAALTALKGAGASVDDTWAGKAVEREAILREKLALALHALQHEREKLVAKYYEDASIVKEIDERIAFNQDQLKAVKVGAPAKMAVFRIYVGPNA